MQDVCFLHNDCFQVMSVLDGHFRFCEAGWLPGCTTVSLLQDLKTRSVMIASQGDKAQ